MLQNDSLKKLKSRCQLISRDGKVYCESFDALLAQNVELQQAYSVLRTRGAPLLNTPPPLGAFDGTVLQVLYSLFGTCTMLYWLKEMADGGGVTVDGVPVTVVDDVPAQPWQCMRLERDVLHKKLLYYRCPTQNLPALHLQVIFREDKRHYRSVVFQLPRATKIAVQKHVDALVAQNSFCFQNLTPDQVPGLLKSEIRLAHFMLVHAYGTAPSPLFDWPRPPPKRKRTPPRPTPEFSKVIATHWFCDHRPDTQKADGCCCHPFHLLFGSAYTNKIEYYCHAKAKDVVPVRRLLFDADYCAVQLENDQERQQILLHPSKRAAAMSVAS